MEDPILCILIFYAVNDRRDYDPQEIVDEVQQSQESSFASKFHEGSRDAMSASETLQQQLGDDEAVSHSVEHRCCVGSCQYHHFMARTRDQNIMLPNDAMCKAGSCRAFSFPDTWT